MVEPPSGTGERTGILWFRRDLRLSDHPVLTRAVREFDRVVPVFVWDPALMKAAGANRVTFLAGCVEELNRSLDGQLVVRCGDPSRMISELAASAGAVAVLATADHGPYGRRRDAAVAGQLRARGIEWIADDSNYAVAPGSLAPASGACYRVFTPFHRAWLEHGWAPPARRPRLDRLTRAGLRSQPAPPPAPVQAELPSPGEGAAHRRLDAFLGSAAGEYDRQRDRPDRDGTTRLSPYLRFGCIHPRQVLARLEPGNRAHDKLAAELCWREFYADVLYHRPDAAHRAYREEFRRFRVDTGEAADRRFAAWAAGRTGYPIVDAGMRQLVAEGWMHNRVRMIVASFLIKDLHLDWRRGARFFMEHLVDGDLASNQLNWQWVAGSGTDAAPYFRVFNPVTQALKFDPDAGYIRRWVPELGTLPAELAHEPWKAKGTLLSGGYPDPIVDHGLERQEALARYDEVRRA